MLRYFFPVDNTVFRDTVVTPNLLPLPGFAGRTDPGQILSNFGQVVVSDPAAGGLSLWTPQRQESISTLKPADPRLLTPDGQFLAYRSRNQLWSANTLSGKQSLLFEGSYLDSADLASLASDDNGRRLLMLIRERKDLPRQWLFTVETNGHNPSWFTFIGEGFREAIYSGDGQTIFATSTSNRLFRYRYNTDSWDELSPRSAYVTEWLGSPWTGSQNQLQGGGFSWQTCDANRFPWPESLCGVELTWLGRRLPIGRVTPTSVNFQIPWDLVIPLPPPPEMFVNPAQFDQLTVSTPKEGFFNDSGLSIRRGLTLLAIDESSLRGDDGRTITSLSPARPGEWLLVELNGLGTASPAIATGMPGPSNPPSRVTEPIEIKVNDIFLPVQSFQAILTPGQVGIYTLRFQLPTSIEGLSSTVVRIFSGADPNRLRINQFQIPLSTSPLP